MNYRIIAIVIVVFITACNTKNKESEGVSSNDLGIDTINFVGMHLNKSIIYVDFNNDTIHPFDELLKNEVKHNLILY
ncbi:MAG: hypothetical protein U9N86_11940, partial [Bacteroidota bacterium]|nr:hypothetical protein [Bacteroidota bacterium]